MIAVHFLKVENLLEAKWAAAASLSNRIRACGRPFLQLPRPGIAEGKRCVSREGIWRLGPACISAGSGSGRLPSLIFKNHPTTTCSCTVGKWEAVKEKGWWESGKNLSGCSPTSLQTPAEGGEEGAGLEHPQRNGEEEGAPPFSRGWVPFTRRDAPSSWPLGAGC